MGHCVFVHIYVLHHNCLKTDLIYPLHVLHIQRSFIYVAPLVFILVHAFVVFMVLHSMIDCSRCHWRSC